jgi:hypothetical protein
VLPYNGEAFSSAGMAELADAADSKADANYLVSISKLSNILALPQTHRTKTRLIFYKPK